MPVVKSAVDVSDTFLELEFSTTRHGHRRPARPTGDRLRRSTARTSVDKVAGWADVGDRPVGQPPLLPGAERLPQLAGPGPGQRDDHDDVDHATGVDPGLGGDLPDRRGPRLATRDLVAAGYSHNGNGQWVDFTGRPLALRLAVDDGDGWAAQAAEFLADQLRSQGVTVSTLAEPDATATGTALSADRADPGPPPARRRPLSHRDERLVHAVARSPRQHRSGGLERVRVGQGRQPVRTGGHPTRSGHRPADLQPDRPAAVDRHGRAAPLRRTGRVGLVGVGDRGHPGAVWGGALLERASRGRAS